MMSDELRRLLDDRGVEYKSHYLNTSWYAGMKLYMATDNTDGTLTVDNLTPEQAIAATLGNGTLTAEQVRTAIFDGSSYASYDGAKYYADGINMQAIADELNTRAERTCYPTTNERGYTMCCSECGRSLLQSAGVLFNYCPNCGAKVVE